MDLKGNDFLFLGLGAGVLYLILSNTKPLGDVVKTVTPVLGNTVSAAGGVVDPLLGAAAKGAAIATNPTSWQPENYAWDLLQAPFSTSQAWTLFKQQPGISTGINAILTSVGLFK